ncbi:hypothetical protein ACFLRF_04620 [Candidatus Altiarchaeota archaeon]
MSVNSNLGKPGPQVEVIPRELRARLDDSLKSLPKKPVGLTELDRLNAWISGVAGDKTLNKMLNLDCWSVDDWGNDAQSLRVFLSDTHDRTTTNIMLPGKIGDFSGNRMIRITALGDENQVEFLQQDNIDDTGRKPFWAWVPTSPQEVLSKYPFDRIQKTFLEELTDSAEYIEEQTGVEGK